MFEISTRRTGISAKDLQRILGFGSYKTAWTWLHKLRTAMVRSDSEPLGPLVQIVMPQACVQHEALVGGKGSPHKELVLVAAGPAGASASPTPSITTRPLSSVSPADRSPPKPKS